MEMQPLSDEERAAIEEMRDTFLAMFRMAGEHSLGYQERIKSLRASGATDDHTLIEVRDLGGRLEKVTDRGLQAASGYVQAVTLLKQQPK